MSVSRLLQVFFVVALANHLSVAGYQQSPKYKDSSAPLDQRVEDLLKRMTLEEKIAQLQCSMGDIEKTGVPASGIGALGPILRDYSAKEGAKKANRIQKLLIEKTRLGIPAIIHDEGLHGLFGKDAVSYPQSIALAASWNPTLVQNVTKSIALQTRSRGIHQVLSPVINIARDARWGRVEETYGEDPYLTSRIGVAYCKGLENENVIATPKHFAANVGDGGRDSYPIHFNERLLREIYFPAFKACFQEGGARSVMSAYNAIDGTPCSSNKWLLTDVLRNEWKFNGFVVSDYGSVAGIKNMHKTAATDQEVGPLAIGAGLEMELPEIEFFGKPLLDAAAKGMISQETIDEAVRRVLRIKFQLGLFEQPYVDAEKAQAEVDNPQHSALSVQAAREGIVLLKNDGVLPLKKDIKNIAVIGALADSIVLGGYSGGTKKTMTLLQGIRSKVGTSCTVQYARGCEVRLAEMPPISEEYLQPFGSQPGERGLKGEYFANTRLSGSPVMTRIDKQVNFNWSKGSPDPKIPVDSFSVRWSGKMTAPKSGVIQITVSSDDGVRLYIDGKLLISNWFNHAVITDMAALKVEAGKSYDIVMEYFENKGDAVASLGWDFVTGPAPSFREALEMAQRADVIVYAAGIIEGEAKDRSSLDLPGDQEKLINALAATGVPVVVVLINGSPVTMSKWITQAQAIVEAWYGGQEQGAAMAAVLFGDYSPGGKLPITFPAVLGQTPIYYNHKPSGRGGTYIDNNGKPLFPFGFGLSYSTFSYTNARLTKDKISAGEKTELRVDITNTGNYEGTEVVQLYLHDVVGSVARPVKELKNFSKVSLKSRESVTVAFAIGREELEFLDQRLQLVFEPGIVECMVGSSSADIRATLQLELLKK